VYRHDDPVYRGFPDLHYRNVKISIQEDNLSNFVPSGATPAPKNSPKKKETEVSVTPQTLLKAQNAPAKRPTRALTGASTRINADNIWLYRFIALGVIAGALAAFATSWAGLLYVAEWQALAPEWQWLTPVMIDIPIVVLSLAALAKRSRGENHLWFLVFAIFLTLLSSAANFAHTVAIRGLDDYTDWIGASLNALAPAFVLFTTEVLGSLVTRPVKKAKK
jgi:hypothetical protein